MTGLLHTLRRVVSTVVLASLWIGVITPLAWLSWLVRGDVLQRRPDPTATTYWQPRTDSDEGGLWSFFVDSGKIWMLPVVLLLLALGVVLVVSESSLVFAFLYPLF